MQRHRMEEVGVATLEGSEADETSGEEQGGSLRCALYSSSGRVYVSRGSRTPHYTKYHSDVQSGGDIWTNVGCEKYACQSSTRKRRG